MIEVRLMEETDIDIYYERFLQYDIKKSKGYITKCWEENKAGKRITLLAFYKGEFAGSLHLLKESNYPFFKENNIPEINDFNVIPPLRQMGIGNALMDKIEEIALKQYGIVGLGVGLYLSYGSAQRMYAKRGYIPDGRGVMYNNEPVPPGTQVCVDDELNLFLTKPCKVKYS